MLKSVSRKSDPDINEDGWGEARSQETVSLFNNPGDNTNQSVTFDLLS
jgi:hypothetical protein